MKLLIVGLKYRMSEMNAAGKKLNNLIPSEDTCKLVEV
jgi:hypothetical protein